MARPASAVLSSADKKNLITNIKTELKAAKDAVKAHDGALKATVKAHDAAVKAHGKFLVTSAKDAVKLDKAVGGFQAKLDAVTQKA